MKKPIALLLIIVVLTSVIYAVDKWNKNMDTTHNNQQKNKNINPYGVPLPQANTVTRPNVLPLIKAMPIVPPDDNNRIANFPDLDRQRLERENLTLLPANEIIQSSYKDWNVGGTIIEKELYATDAPLFNGEKIKLVPLDINGTQRRVNFF
jgi:hypothetical protein